MKTFLRCLIVSVALVAALFGCAGGSRGTGGQLFDGSVFDGTGRALIGVTVTVTGTGDSSTTGADGSYSILTDVVSGDVEFLIEGPGFTARSIAAGVPADATHVVVNFVVGTGSNPTVDIDVEVKERSPKPGHGGSDDNGGSSSGSSSDDNSSNPSSDDNGGLSSSTSDDGLSSSDDNGGTTSTSDDSTASSSDDNGGGVTPGGGGSTPGGNGQPTPTPSPVPALVEGATIDAQGAIASVSGSGVVLGGRTFIPTATSQYRFKNGANATLGDFSAGDNAKARGIVSGGVILLQRLEFR